MKNYGYLVLMFYFLIVACNSQESHVQIKEWENEIRTVEQEFNDMAQRDGLAKAFEFYAAPEGVIKRNNKIIQGRNAIAEWYKQDVRPNESLTWTPTFVSVSQSGDLAYTYGDFIFTYPDSLGHEKQNTGIFHTVWRRQADGSWRFVWD